MDFIVYNVTGAPGDGHVWVEEACIGCPLWISVASSSSCGRSRRGCTDREEQVAADVADQLFVDPCRNLFNKLIEASEKCLQIVIICRRRHGLQW
jgi:hypothetical protein